MPERDSLEFDVLFVGAGPASLAGAYHLAGLIEQHNQQITSGAQVGKKLEDITIAVIEKGREVNSHALSGAILDPRALHELIPDFAQRQAPVETPVVKDYVYYLTERRKFSFPVIPPPLHNDGHYVISLGKLVRWLAEQCEKKGINIFPEFPAAEFLFEGDRVVGVRAGEKGLDKHGQPKANYEPGADLFAKVTVLGEGPRGTLTKRLIRKFELDRDCNPQVYSVGVKEIWKLPAGRLRAGTVMHTLGYPLGQKIFGGSFLYMMGGDVLDIGLVVGLEYEDPGTDPHRLFCEWKQHPFIAGLLQGAELLGYGAKAIPEGGLYSQPKMVHDGAMIIGDSAGFLNSQRLKGIHLGMKSGMLAAEAILQALLSDDFSRATLELYPQKYRRSWAFEEMYRVRNFHQGFEDGLFAGMLHAGLQMITGGRGVRERYPCKAGHERLRILSEKNRAATVGTCEKILSRARKQADSRRRVRSLTVAARIFSHVLGEQSSSTPEVFKFDNVVTFDKVTDVYHSGAAHNEDQPCHLRVQDLDICHNRCTFEYGNPCQHFCPAAVYEILRPETGKVQLQINFSNCVHCKTCDIMDPYQIIDWVAPEGGDGPNYKNM